ncbi:MAG: hypothetical protein IRZ00_13250 [Gemmatimonadetes bacterium]|nr:hypothetical protein [Gemmatimonadota bacterium]
MSAVLGVFGPAADRPALADAAVARMLEAMRGRGLDRTTLHREAGAVLAVGRYDWELGAGFSGPVLVEEEGDLVVAADASIYYRAELMRALAGRGVVPRSDTPSHLILAAYRAWGVGCTQHLEGDFAFILWDRAAHRVFCARDFGGKRPLFWAELGDTLVVASAIAAVVASPGCPDELNLAVIAEDAAGLTGSPAETCYRAVSRLPPGWSLSRERDRAARAAAHWVCPTFAGERGRGARREEAVAQLRDLLERAVAERLAIDGHTSVWMSGGWDSPSIFATGKSVLAGDAAGRELRAVSVSYPPGDPGREDELIEAIAGHWSAPVHWVPADAIALFSAVPEQAARRDEAYAHRFEAMLRALADASRAAGTRVSLDGAGGDQLFQVGSVYLADLLRHGHWRTLAREWRTRQSLGDRALLENTIVPVLPHVVLAIAAAVRQDPKLGLKPLERPIPEWVDPAFARRYRLRERERSHLPPAAGLDHAAYQSLWTLVAPTFGRLASYTGAFALEAGVEHRSPFYDRRLLEFAAARPRAERNTAGDQKRLLRKAMRGLLPDAVLAPRSSKTGLSHGPLHRSLRDAAPVFMDGLRRGCVLADLGIAVPGMLARWWEEYLRSGEMRLAVGLSTAMPVEWWLRARLGDPGRPRTDLARRTGGAGPAGDGHGARGSGATWHGRHPVQPVVGEVDHVRATQGSAVGHVP